MKEYSARVLCEALSIARGTYHKKRIVKQDNPTVYAQRRKEISEQVRAVFQESDQRYGADKIVAVLAERGIHTSKKYVLKLTHLVIATFQATFQKRGKTQNLAAHSDRGSQYV